MNTDEKIRAILQMEGDAVEPSAAGYDAIKAGIEARRRRTWWVRGSAFAGTAVATAAAVVVMAGDPTPQTIQPAPSTSVGTEPTTGPTAPTATPTVVAQPDARPLGTIWPLTTHGELRAWQKDNATYPSLSSPSTSALAFAKNYLLTPDATVEGVGESNDGGQVFRMRRGTVVVSTLEVLGFGDGGTAPYLVTRATSEAVRISSPLPETKAASPLRVDGDYQEVEPAITVRLRADGPGSAPIELGDVRATASPSNTWRAELAYTTTATTGSLMVTVGSPTGDGFSAAAVIPLTLTPSATPQGDVFAGVRDFRVAVFAPNGEFVRFLNDRQPGGGPSAPDVSPDGSKVVWAQGAGTCATTVQYEPVTGGTPVVVDSGADGVATMPVWVGDGRIAYALTPCAGTAEMTEIRIYDVASRSTQTIVGMAAAPTSMAASPDGKHLAWIMNDVLNTYQFSTGAARSVDPAPGCRWRSVDVAGTTTAGRAILVTASTCPGSSTVVVERFAQGAPDRDRVAEVKHDGAAYRVSYDAASGATIVSHGLEDGVPYAEVFGRDGSRKVVRNADQVSW